MLVLVDDRDDAAQVRRELRHVSLTTVSNVEQALAAVRREGPFAVLVCHMSAGRTREIGVLWAMKHMAPEMVRVLITADDGPQTAAAVNVASVFRLLRNPCPAEVLRGALDDALDWRRQQDAGTRREVEGLTGAIEALVMNLQLANPAAAQRAARVRRLVRKIAAEWDPHHAGEYELAALLSQVGAVRIPQATTERLCAGVSLSADERRLLAQHPVLGAGILANIPRLKRIARIVACQDLPFAPEDPARGAESATVPPGARILRLALDADLLDRRGIPARDIVAALHQHHGAHDPAVIAAFERAFRVEGCCSLAAPSDGKAPARIRRKVLGMLRLATDHAATPAEAANARRKADQLIARHRLALSTL